MSCGPIRAVFLDAAGTLFHLRESVGDGYARVAQRHQFSMNANKTDSAFRTLWKSMPPMGTLLEPGRDPSERDWWKSLVSKVVDQVAPGACGDFDAFFADLFGEYAKPELWSLYPETRKVLDQLRVRQLRLFVLSNFDSRLIPVLDGLGISDSFEEIFYSGAIGHAKPSPEIFSQALSSSNLEPWEALHVGDDPIADWQGARNAGMQVFELDRQQADLQGVLALENLADFSD